MADETKTDEPKNDLSEAEKRIAAMSPEQRTKLRDVIDGIANDVENAEDQRTLKHGSNHAASAVIRKKYGYTPDY